MCGFTGFWDFKLLLKAQEIPDLLRKMIKTINHRGPDDTGIWWDPQHRMGMAHARLAIQDLSDAGHQPMFSHNQRYVMVYNGEIYNYKELREELKHLSFSFRSTSDTEILLAGIEAWGLDVTLKKCTGMFSLALWDQKEKTLSLARDRIGVKPLYWGIMNQTLFFGSQPKSFFPHPCFYKEINPDAAHEYFYYNYIPAPFSIFKNIEKLQPAEILTVSGPNTYEKRSYWTLKDTIQDARSQPPLPTEERLEHLHNTLKESVACRMIADAPLGAFLSGGIDSSLVVSLMQSLSSSPIQTFSIGFENPEFNEAPYARAIANILKTNHHEHIVTANDALKIIPQIPIYFDEPFGDSSQIPTLLVSQFARPHVKVVLSGDGGDELFAGYNRYAFLKKLEGINHYIPYFLRKHLGQSLNLIPSSTWNLIQNLLSPSSRPQSLKDKITKISYALKGKTLDEQYLRIISAWQNEMIPYPSSAYNTQDDTPAHLEPVEQWQYRDMKGYLPDDVLTKVDRATMAFGLEAREPLLDHRLIQQSWLLPLSLKIHKGNLKWPLRHILSTYLPRDTFNNRPKIGFGVPLQEWLLQPLRPWAEDLLSIQNLQNSLVPHPEKIHALWQDFKQGHNTHHHHGLWGVLMWQAWHQHHSPIAS